MQRTEEKRTLKVAWNIMSIK